MLLEQFFQQYPEIAVAFSGGVDSSCLLYMAKKHAQRVTAFYMSTAFQTESDRTDAVRFCEEYQIPLNILEYDILQNEQVAQNPPDRCYHCKTAMFREIRHAAGGMGFSHIADGTNASDDPNRRPGMRALAELGILSPLRACDMTKEDIRARSRQLGLPTADKPSFSCLATRIPAGERLTALKLRNVRQSGEN